MAASSLGTSFFKTMERYHSGGIGETLASLNMESYMSCWTFGLLREELEGKERRAGSTSWKYWVAKRSTLRMSDADGADIEEGCEGLI